MGGLKGIISLTSWRGRIATAGLTIFNLMKTCDGFKVALTLSSDEFPGKLGDLPDDIRLLAETRAIDLIWAEKDYKSFKKVLFAMKRYPGLPVVSADDDCLYLYDYASELYDRWRDNRDAIVTQTTGAGIPWGYATLHPPMAYDLDELIRVADYCVSHGSFHDDLAFFMYAKRHGIPIISLEHGIQHVARFHTANGSLAGERLKRRNDMAVVTQAFDIVPKHN